MRDFTDGLGSADRGSIAEQWYTKVYEGGEFLDAAHKVPNERVARHPKFVEAVLEAAGITQDKSSRVPDIIIETTTIKDIKHVTGPLSQESITQLEVFAEMVGKTLKAEGVGGQPGELYTPESLVVVITEPMGAVKNSETIVRMVARETVSFEIFNEHGDRKLVTSADLETISDLNPSGTREGLINGIEKWAQPSKN
jgi:hypothetical protein